LIGLFWFGWLFGWLVGWFAGWLVALVGFVGWSVSLVGWLVGLVLFGWMVDFIGWLASCLACLVGRSVGQFVGLNTWKGVSDFDD